MKQPKGIGLNTESSNTGESCTNGLNITHKRFLLFGVEKFYPAGGLNDICDSFDTLEQAKEHAAEKFKVYSIDYHIYDRIEGKEVFRKEFE